MQYGRYNGAGNVNSLNILQNDIQYGFTDASGAYNPNYTGYPNTIRVMGRLDPTANGSLPLFFGGITGRDKSALTASSNATIYTGVINSFDPNSGSWGDNPNDSCHCNHPCLLLPVAFDINSWKQFFATGASPDGVVHTDSTGAAQIQIYPSPQMAPGNFGLLCIGPWTNSDAIYADWVEYGPSASDIQTLIDEGKLPTSESNPKSWKGSPGLRNTLRKQFIDIIGMPRLLPLFIPASQNPYQAASGVGSNASYKIAAFAGVKVTSVTGNGTNLNITVQPYDVLDPTALYDSSTICPVGTEVPAQMKSFTHTAPKLTQ